ncbi:YncE family protein [Bdellovibrio svalbardensis]|uniref:Uncharacterized protein n=1 Tax=Bdellovibrio svalbardensis TaxID=2972972 RepID=A0ABT6DM18_9BACT|nr:hypothetical protein [Bdellovibrio svalbardensis]MDG0817644.1 hypothetical protein [Bdellovibrio svalbardensis]
MAWQKVFLAIALLMSSGSAKASLKDLAKYATKDFLLGTAPTGCMPKGMKIDPQGAYLYVAEMCGKIDPTTKKRVPTASIYDLQKRSLQKTLITPVGMRDGILANTEVEFSLDKKWALISRAEGDSRSEIFQNYGLLTVVNSATQNIVKYIPTKGEGSKIIAARPLLPNDPSRKQIIYVANYFSDDISVIDVSDLAEDGNLDGSRHYVGRVKLNTNFRNPRSKSYLIAPRGVAFTPDGKYALILATETGSLIVMDAVAHKQIAELAPITKEIAGRELNVRHILISKDGQTAYLSHMHGNAVSRVNVNKLISKITSLPKRGPDVTLPASFWNDLFIPFESSTGKKNILVLEDYPKDHPNFPGKKWPYAHPNTIVLDPVNERYLYVSSRTTSNSNDSQVDRRIKGKIDIVDTTNGTVIFTLVGGAQPTALEVTRDNATLISSGFIDDHLYFFDLKKILDLYQTTR